MSGAQPDCQDTTLEVCIGLCADLAHRVAGMPGLTARITEAVAEETESLCRTLGVPAVVRAAADMSMRSDLLFYLSVSGEVVRPSLELLAEVGAYFRPGLVVVEPWRIEWQSFVEWFLPKGAAPEQETVAVHILAELSGRLLAARPDCLLSDTVVDDVLNRIQWEQLALTPRLGQVLRRAVQLGASLTDDEALKRALSRGIAAGLGDEDLVEELVAILQPDTIRLMAHPRYFGLLAGDASLRETESGNLRAERDMHDRLVFLREGILHELGLRLPAIRFEACEAHDDDTFAVAIGPFRGLLRHGLPPRHVFVNDAPSALAARGVEATPWRSPVMPLGAAIAGEADAARLESAGIATWPPRDFVILTIAGEVRRGTKRLLSRDGLDFELALLESDHADLVLQARQTVPAASMIAILRALLAELTSIRDLPLILEAMISYFGSLGCTEADAASGRHAEICLREVRTKLKRQITFDAANQHTPANLVVYVLQSALEDRLAQHIAGQPLSELEASEFRAAVREQFRRLPPRSQPPRILTRGDVRRAVWELLVDEFPWIRVISYEELTIDASLQPVARIPN